jgi:hypothetical protein
VIICESEADTISASLKQDWGNFSDLLRKAFHHESVSYIRKTNKEHKEANTPRLSMALTGTPSQVTGLINSHENGLFSRFAFYCYEQKPCWKDVSPGGSGVNYTDFFKVKAESIARAVDFLNQYPTEFNLAQGQWKQFNTQFRSRLFGTCSLLGAEVSSTVYRLGLTTFRTAMILSTIRKVEMGNRSLNIECTDIDFETAMMLSETYLDHAMLMFTKLPGENKSYRTSGEQKLLVALPADREFQRKEAVYIGKTIQISERTVSKYLNQLLSAGSLLSESYGKYIKA